MKNQKFKRFETKKKMPFSLKLIFIWMVFIVIRGLAKLTNLGRLEENYLLLGKPMAITNYVIDSIVLVAFVILICLFILKNKNFWKYFVGIIVFMITGVLVGFIYLPGTISLFPSEAQSFALISTIIMQILLLLFYTLLIFIVYRKRGYFQHG